MAGGYWQRTILVVAALVCLCVSDSAGPRLLPLPALAPISARDFCSHVSDCTALVPSQKKKPCTYIEMVASQYRAREGDNHEQPATHNFQASLNLQPTNLARAAAVFAPLNVNTPSLSAPVVRGPPCFVSQ